jgi:hypothetical protein
MRAAKALFCGAALLALLVPGVRADDYNKLTYFTFSGSVQVPGATLPAGKYMFKLADPESGRRAIQIWDEEGKKLFTTLLTVADQRMEVPKEPMVMFNEQPSGEAPAVRSWFYEGERTGYEFVYPKNQAMKIAAASHQPVLARTDEPSGPDLDALNAQVARVNETGQTSDTDSAAASAAPRAASSTTSASSTSSTTSSASSSTSTSDVARATPAPRPTDAAPADTAPAATSGTTTAQATSTPSGNRTDSSAPVPAQADTARPAPAAAATAPRQTPQPPSSTVAQSQSTLPRTGSSLPLLGLLSGLSLFGALGTRELRRRLAHNW